MAQTDQGHKGAPKSRRVSTLVLTGRGGSGMLGVPLGRRRQSAFNLSGPATISLRSQGQAEKVVGPDVFRGVWR